MWGFSFFPWGGSSPSLPPKHPSLLSPLVKAFIWKEHLLEELERGRQAKWLLAWVEESPSDLYLALDLPSFNFNFFNYMFELTTILGLPIFSSISCGVKILARFEYPTKLKCATKIPSWSNSFIARAKPKWHNLNSLATYYMWEEFQLWYYQQKMEIG